MKKIKYLILLAFVYQIVLEAQEFKVSYEMNVFPNTFISYFDLKIFEDYSQWEYIGYADSNSMEEVSIVQSSRPRKFYSIANKHYYQEILFGKYLNVVDEPDLKWNLTQKMDSINQHLCQIATTEFRGRKYTACFSNEIKISQGPWKFKGLPGLIIHVKSDDDFIEYSLQSISKLDENEFRQEAEDYLSLEFMEFSDFQDRFIRVHDNYIKSQKSKKENHSFDSYYKINQAEIIYPSLQTGNGIVY